MTDLADKLRTVRRFTGDKFSAARGYDARKPMSKARARTIARYYEAIKELTGRAHMLVTPKRGEKREMFEFTGQARFPRFVKAIIVKPIAADPYTYTVDKTRPKGSRFILVNKRTRERSWHIPAHVFLDENEALYDPDADIEPQFFEDVLNEYAVQGPNTAYMIEAGDYHMWGSAGDIPTVSAKLSELFKNYGSDIFDADDKSSHFIGNWFRGIQVFTEHESRTYREERANAAVTRIREFNKQAGRQVRQYGQSFRVLKSGDIGEFVFGKLVRIIPGNAATRANAPIRDKAPKGFKLVRQVKRKRKPPK